MQGEFMAEQTLHQIFQVHPRVCGILPHPLINPAKAGTSSPWSRDPGRIWMPGLAFLPASPTGTSKLKLPAQNMAASQPHHAPAWDSGLVHFPVCPSFPHPHVCLAHRAVGSNNWNNICD